MSYVQLSKGGFQVVYPLGLWSRLSGVVKSYMDMASKLFTITFTFTFGGKYLLGTPSEYPLQFRPT